MVFFLIMKTEELLSGDAQKIIMTFIIKGCKT